MATCTNCGQAQGTTESADDWDRRCRSCVRGGSVPYAVFRHAGQTRRLGYKGFWALVDADCPCGHCLACRAREYAQETGATRLD